MDKMLKEEIIKQQLHDVDEFKINLDQSIPKKEEIESFIDSFRQQHSQKERLITQNDIDMVMKKALQQLDQWIRQDDQELYQHALQDIGLFEKPFGQKIILYPVQKYTKKMNSQQLQKMIQRLSQKNKK